MDTDNTNHFGKTFGYLRFGTSSDSEQLNEFEMFPDLFITSESRIIINAQIIYVKSILQHCSIVYSAPQFLKDIRKLEIKNFFTASIVLLSIVIYQQAKQPE